MVTCTWYRACDRSPVAGLQGWRRPPGTADRSRWSAI